MADQLAVEVVVKNMMHTAVRKTEHRQAALFALGYKHKKDDNKK